MPHPSNKKNQPCQFAFSDPHDILNNAPIGVFTTTPEGYYTSANPALARMLGYESPEELIASITEIATQVYADPEDHEEIMRLMQEHGNVVDHECRFKRKDGTEFWVSINGRAVRDEDGRIVAYQGFTTDIAERKRTEKKAESEGRLRNILLDNLPNCIALIMKKQTREIVASNKNAAKIGAVPGKTCFATCAEREDECPFCLAPELWATNQLQKLEVKYRGKWYEGVWAPFTDDLYIRYIFDITDHKRAEEELREREALLIGVLNNMQDAYFRADPSGRITFANPAASRMFSLGSVEEIIGTYTKDFYAKSEDCAALIGALQEQGVVADFACQASRADGSYFWISMSGNLIRDDDGQIVGLEGVARDITDRKLAEEERKRLQAQLHQAQKMESIGMLAGGIAHDFNNLLHAMGGNLELLDMKIPDDHPGKKRILTIQKSMDRSSQLIKKLLLFSRKADIRKQVLDLNQEIHDAVKLLERSIPRMISIELILDENAWPINADPIQVEQMLLNMGANSADAMPEGGRLIIETANVLLDQDFVRTHAGAKPGKYVLMTVTDTGTGMDQDTLEKIFDPFFTTKEVDKGTGLGLASAYGIVKAHEGYITCESKPGQGTKFMIYWPAVKN